jgi:hypothetical protein
MFLCKYEGLDILSYISRNVEILFHCYFKEGGPGSRQTMLKGYGPLSFRFLIMV